MADVIGKAQGSLGQYLHLKDRSMTDGAMVKYGLPEGLDQERANAHIVGMQKRARRQLAEELELAVMILEEERATRR